MKKSWPFLVLTVVLLAAGVIWFFVLKPDPPANTIRVSGNIEATNVQLSFKIPGRLEACFADEGDTVAKGQLIARLESIDQKITLVLAKTNLTRAKSVLSELEAGNRPEEIQLAHAKVCQAQQTLLELTRGSRDQEIKSAESDLETALAAEKSAQIHLSQSRADYDRFSILMKKGSISRRDLELTQTQYEMAQSSLVQSGSRVNIARQNLSLRREGPRPEQIEKARATLVQAQAEYALVKAGPRQEKIDQATALVNEAAQKLNQARQQLSDTRLMAPMTGVILSRSAEPGEYLNVAAPVLTLGDLDHPWLRAFITESDLGRLKLNDRVDVTTDSFPGKTYKGRLSFISSQAEFTPKSVQTFEERVKLMFRIKITLSNPDSELKQGMPADAVFSLPPDTNDAH